MGLLLLPSLTPLAAMPTWSSIAAVVALTVLLYEARALLRMGETGAGDGPEAALLPRIQAPSWPQPVVLPAAGHDTTAASFGGDGSRSRSRQRLAFALLLIAGFALILAALARPERGR